MKNELEIAYTYAANELFSNCMYDAYEKYLVIEYKCGKGHFKIALYKLICAFSISDFKKVMTMLYDDFSGQDKATQLHDLFISILANLQKSKQEYLYDKKKLSEISAALCKLNQLNELLRKYFTIEPLMIEPTIKFKKAIAYKMVSNNLVVDYNAKSFIKYGRTWIVSADSNVKGLKHIILPCCGLACASYTGSYKEAIEIIDNELNVKVNKAINQNIFKEKTIPEFIALLKQNGIEKIPA